MDQVEFFCRFSVSWLLFVCLLPPSLILLFSEAGKHEMVVGSQARILYSDQRGRTALALRFPHLGQIYFECSASMPRFNAAIAAGDIEGTVVISRDHHDVSGTDSPFR